MADKIAFWEQASRLEANSRKAVAREEGREEGIKTGMARGRKLERYAMKQKTAKKLLSLQMPIEQIAEVTELSVEEIEKLQEER